MPASGCYVIAPQLFALVTVSSGARVELPTGAAMPYDPPPVSEDSTAS